MAKLTLTYEGAFKVAKTVVIPDEHHDDYISAHIESLTLHHPGKERPSDKAAIEAHLDAIIREIERTFSNHVNRKAVNEYIKTLPTKRLGNG